MNNTEVFRGKEIGTLRVTQIGNGGEGNVYAALQGEDLRDAKIVAVKSLLLSKLAIEQRPFVAKRQMETHALLSEGNRHVIPYITSGIAE